MAGLTASPPGHGNDEGAEPDFTSRIEGLSPQQRALFQGRLAAAAPTTRPTTIPRREPSGPTERLSFAQERLWLLEQLSPGNPTYNMPVVLNVGAVPPTIVEQAINAIVARHEALRTVFHLRDGSPLQVIRPAVQVPLSVLDAGRLGAGRDKSDLHHRLSEESQLPFDLAHGPLIRATLAPLPSGEQMLMVVCHHLVFDLWSAELFSRELATIGQSLSRGETPDLAPLPIQYADFAVWQRADLSGPRADELRRYWTRRLEGAPDAVALPVDRVPRGARSFRGAFQLVPVDTPTTGALRQLTQAERATLFMTLLACFKAFLFRYTAQNDLVVGSPVSGRTTKEIEPLIGLFVNTVVLRADVRPQHTFRALLREVRQAVIEAYAHQDLPFDQVLAAASTRRDPLRNPMYNIMFGLQASPGGDTVASGPQESWSKFDLSLTVLDSGNYLCARWEYATDLFDHATATRLARHFGRLVDHVARHPDEVIASLPLLTDAEHHEYLVKWNASQRPTTGLGVPASFEAQVERSPEATAVVQGERTLTYRALNRRANVLAAELRHVGVGPDARVGVCMAPGPELVVAVLAVLKAGGAWVPLDPTYPPERLRVMVADAGTAVVLTQAGLVPMLEAMELSSP
ncbi:MAG: condensation domain-containing protein, partial [Candidatus Limnocylindrales bacterium]